MILIADSGSTKTDWCVVGNSGKVLSISTQGINPLVQSENEVERVLRAELMPAMTYISDITDIRFYGAGCRDEMITVLERLLRKVFPAAVNVCVYSDLLAVARALCGKNEGIACILGTGANSCLYDGEHITANTPALGYILGDEGSGAVLGKLFVNALFKGRLSDKVRTAFEAETQLTMPVIINKVYRQPMPNRFLASLSLFIGRHIDEPDLHRLVVDNFRSFLVRNIRPYCRPDLPVNAIGSMAYHYRECLEEAARAEGMRIGTVMKSPMEGLVRYHSDI
ncbi:ATPase [Prevotella sp. PCHR]|uniref:ATPase n=1 Tax=Xylanibacter caecicola TaxID=2736294 RepID=A0ABX2B5W1_9BACT|nr:ATPase [Xylanibacter caecicola]NPE26342.1 ATPase [Xylanibacter caecicola]